MKRDQIIGLCALLLLAAGIGFAGDRRLAEASERLSEERAYQELLTATPLAEIEGETVSPDGRFEIRTTGKSSLYVSGVVVPESLQVVDRESGKVLWKGEGMVWQSALWSPEGGYLVLARSARTWCSVMVIDTELWTEWEFTLPDGGAIPEYVFLSHDTWGQWRSENRLDLTIGRGGDGEEPSYYSCAIVTEEDGRVSGTTRERTEETLPGRYDFNHDGTPETVQITSVWQPGKTETALEYYTVRVVDSSGAALWEDQAGTSHAGENSFYALRLEDQDYLLQYIPHMGQGYCSYQYRIFSLDGTGEPVIRQENQVSFDVNFGSPIHEGFEIPAIAAFLQEVHGLLEQAQVLVSTVSGEIDLGEVDYGDLAALERALEEYRAE